MRILVAYYSRSGITRGVAEALAARLDADLAPIEETDKRHGIRGYLRSALEARRGVMPELLPERHDPLRYDLVVVGTPVWFGHVSSPVRSYLHAHRGAIRQAAFFCTLGGRGAERAFDDMREALGLEPVHCEAFLDHDIAGETHYAALERFAGFLRAAAMIAPPARRPDSPDVRATRHP